MLVDSHCHLTDRAFEGERGEVVRRAAEAGVGVVVSIASTLEDGRDALSLAERFPSVWSTVGIHPHEASGWSPAMMDGIRELASASSRVVALGETGLDHHYDVAPRAVQLRSFEAHLELGVELDLPVVVHCRNAEEEMEAVIRSSPEGSRGVLHCFAGGPSLLETALERGWFVSFGGIVTFRRYDGADLLRAVPRDRFMLETDSPYLTPVPFRGRRNEPAHIPLVRDVVASILGVTPDEVAAWTTGNARRFFRRDFQPGGSA